MPEPIELPLYDPARPRRVVLALGGGCALVAMGAFALLAGRPEAYQHTPTGQTIILALILACIGALAMLMIGLAMVYSARRTRAVMERLRRGDVLADWTVAPSDWQPFVASQGAKLGKNSRRVAWLFASPISIAGYIVLVGTTDGVTRLEAALGAAIGGGAVWWLTWQLALGSVAKRIDLLRGTPRILIGTDGVYCGGVLTVWNANMTVLRSARLVAGSPNVVEFTTGSGKTAQAIDGVAVTLSVLSVAAGGDAVTSGSARIKTTVQAPVPAGREEEAGRVVANLLAGSRSAVAPPPTQAGPSRLMPNA